MLKCPRLPKSAKPVSDAMATTRAPSQHRRVDETLSDLPMTTVTFKNWDTDGATDTTLFVKRGYPDLIGVLLQAMNGPHCWKDEKSWLGFLVKVR